MAEGGQSKARSEPMEKSETSSTGVVLPGSDLRSRRDRPHHFGSLVVNAAAGMSACRSGPTTRRDALSPTPTPGSKSVPSPVMTLTNPVNLISPNGVTASGAGTSGSGYPEMGTPPSLAPSSRAVWDKTLGPVISTANDACFENWTDAAVCAAVAAAAVGFGLGMEAILGASGLTGTAATFSTWLGAFSTAFQAVLTYADCRNGVDGSCVVNVAATVLAGLGLGLAGLGGKVAHGGAWVDLAVPLATFGLAASSAGAIFGLPPVGQFADSANEC